MKRSGTLNPALAEAFARLGHGHQVVIADCGLPLPRGAVVVDLALVQGVPRFTDVLDVVLAELVIDGCVAASEAGPVVLDWLTARSLRPQYITHEELKAGLGDVALIIRTGEATPFANVVLTCGVPF